MYFKKIYIHFADPGEEWLLSPRFSVLGSIYVSEAIMTGQTPPPKEPTKCFNTKFHN